jgi:hypothetical protein
MSSGTRRKQENIQITPSQKSGNDAVNVSRRQRTLVINITKKHAVMRAGVTPNVTFMKHATRNHGMRTFSSMRN